MLSRFQSPGLLGLGLRERRNARGLQRRKRELRASRPRLRPLGVPLVSPLRGTTATNARAVRKHRRSVAHQFPIPQAMPDTLRPASQVHCSSAASAGLAWDNALRFFPRSDCSSSSFLCSGSRWQNVRRRSRRRTASWTTTGTRRSARRSAGSGTKKHRLKKRH